MKEEKVWKTHGADLIIYSSLQRTPVGLITTEMIEPKKDRNIHVSLDAVMAAFAIIGRLGGYPQYDGVETESLDLVIRHPSWPIMDCLPRVAHAGAVAVVRSQRWQAAA